MKLSFLKKSDNQENNNQEEDEMNTTTKIKVVAALLVVGIATYVAYWVQEPSQIRADVMESTTQEDSALLAQADDLVESAQAEEDAMNEPEDVMTEDLMLGEEDIMEAESEGLVSEESVGPSLIAQASEDDGMGLKQEEIAIENFAFEPADLTIEQGTVVIWTNNDVVPHTITAESFSSGTLNPGDSFSFTFDREGEFDYTCSFHPQMRASITVLPQGGMNSLLEDMAMEEDDGLLMLGDAEEESEPLSLSELGLLEDQAESQNVAMAAPQNEGDLSKSGPEDILYVVLFGALLWWNRKKFLAKR